jgi:2'-5' RNA ligase
VRLFIAIEIDDEAKRAIAREQKRLADAIALSGLRWTRPEQMHMTLVFLGEIAEQQLEPIVSSLKSFEQGVPTRQFEMTFGGAGVFPARGAPRVLWLGLTGGEQTVTSVQGEISRRLAQLDAHESQEDRPFHPHMTLARWRTSRSKPGADDRRRLTEGIRSGGDTRTIARTRVGSIALFRSTPSPEAGAGPTYTPLARVTLN